MMAQDRTISSLRSASRYLCTILVQRGILRNTISSENSNYSKYLYWLYQYHDEWFTVMQVLIDLHHLVHFDATFAENLYGLKRTKLTTSQNQLVGVHAYHLSWKQILATITFTSILPYVKLKCDEWYSEHHQQQSTNQILLWSEMNWRQKCIYTATKVYPFINVAWESTHFVYILNYLFQNAKSTNSAGFYYTPFLHLQKHSLQRLHQSEFMEQQKRFFLSRLSTLQHLYSKQSTLFNILAWILKWFYKLSDYSRYLLLFFVFGFKILEWWFSNENYLRPNNSSTVMIPDAPKPPQRAPKGLELPKNMALCPICLNEKRNTTVLTVSGFTFCYSCIYAHVNQHEKCPITWIPATTQHLRRIYEK